MQGLVFFTIVLLSLGFAVLGGYLLFRRGWFLAWLKGSLGFVSFVAILLLFFFALDFSSYRQLRTEKPLATISVYALDKQLFDVSLAVEDQLEQRFEIKGDQWQLDVRMFTWKGPFAVLGQKPLYRLDRISGRYVSLYQARSGERSVYNLSPESVFDVWHWFYGAELWLDANYGSAVYMPLENGAVYSINLTDKGIVARPLNGIAEQILKRNW